MRDYPKSVIASNLRLHQLGVVASHPVYQWRWTDDLTMECVIVDESGRAVLDNHCFCGINVNVHSSACNFTAVRPRFETARLLPQYPARWCMAQWMAPPSEEQWQASLGDSAPWPRNGYYVPVSAGARPIVIKQGATPSLDDTLRIIAAVNESEQELKHGKWRAKAEAELARNEQSVRDERLYRFKQMAPVGFGAPGQKLDWSVGGTGENVALRQFSEESKLVQ